MPLLLGSAYLVRERRRGARATDEADEGWARRGVETVSPSHRNASVWIMQERTVLHSVDENRNRYRFFVIELWSPPVGTGAALRKRWGRIGQEGRSETIYFDTRKGAEHCREVLIRRRFKRGYVEVEG